MPDRVLAVLTAPDIGREGGARPFRIVDIEQPVVSAIDLGATRGDGVFETISVARGRAQALEPHLKRLGRSAAMLDMAPPDLDDWQAAVFAVAERLPADREAYVKLVYTRGVEGADRPSGWVLGETSPDHTASRRDGVAVVVLDRGYPHDVAGTAPWLLQGAKTLSYALNRAAVREANRRGADDVLFVSSDRYLLEGATSNLLIKRGDRLVTPSTSLGILAGTTQADAFRFARGEGMTTSYELLAEDELASADALWLVSSVRHAAPIREIDGVARQIDAAFTTALNAFLIGRTD